LTENPKNQIDLRVPHGIVLPPKTFLLVDVRQDSFCYLTVTMTMLGKIFPDFGIKPILGGY
jgi:hypothetical protein